MIDNKTKIKMEDIQDVVKDFSDGKPVIVMDDHSRENEGDIIISAAHCNEEIMTTLIRHTTGIICTPMTSEIAECLDLPRMVTNNKDPHGTSFTVTCDSLETTTGVSSYDRCLTVKALTELDPKRLNRPGHVFPLIANDDLLLKREGHTEAAVTLCRVAKIHPEIAVIGELMNDDGTMMRLPEATQFARKHKMKITHVSDLKTYYQNWLLSNKIVTGVVPRSNVKVVTDCTLPINGYGIWRLYCFSVNTRTQIVLMYEKNSNNNEDRRMLLRIHSSCFTGDVLGSSRCDCGRQLEKAISYIYDQGSGMIIYEMNHEGRGIGLIAKLQAYSLMDNDEKMDTYQANNHLGFEDDMRCYRDCYEVLNHFNIDKVALLTNNPTKAKALQKFGIDTKTVPTVMDIPATEHNSGYLKAKRGKGHKIEDKKVVIKCGLAKSELRDKTITIIKTTWNGEYVNDLTNDCCNELMHLGVLKGNIKVIEVPGAFELPLGAMAAIDKVSDGVICIGVLIKGETMHFEYISSPVCHQIMELQVKHRIPIIYGVLNVLTRDQALARASKNSGLAVNWARSCLSMIELLH
jgi:3,4-dihydroxy 2-butanone 4-phosphate synthase/GTP cyclohydrolase II